jgi:2-oxoglutarate dehydrogenase E1 component
MSGLVMLLPHGYEGQGPEHSSARLERFLQACANYNITVANLTTPANLFHAMRRQLERPFRKPLIIMSPKSLLRHPLCVSDMTEFEAGTHFHEYYDDPEIGPKEVKGLRKVIFCSGKIYYDLLERKIARSHHDVAIVRIEQLYPFPKKQLLAIHEKYANVETFWAQEEPANMGAWTYIKDLLSIRNENLISRKSSASPATGYKKVHDEQQEDILIKAFE